MEGVIVMIRRGTLSRAIGPCVVLFYLLSSAPHAAQARIAWRAMDVAIDPCRVLSPAVASVVLKGTPSRGRPSTRAVGTGETYSDCFYRLATAGLRGPSVQFGIYQRNPTGRGPWSLDDVWSGNQAGLRAGGFTFSAVKGVGNGAIWVPSLDELFVLERPTAMVVVLYRMSYRTPTLNTVVGVSRLILAHFPLRAAGGGALPAGVHPGLFSPRGNPTPGVASNRIEQSRLSMAYGPLSPLPRSVPAGRAQGSTTAYTFSPGQGRSYQVSLRQQYLSVISAGLYGAEAIRTVQTLRLSLAGHTASGAVLLRAVGGTGTQVTTIQGRTPATALISPAATQALTVTLGGLLRGASGLNEGFRGAGSPGGRYSGTVSGLVPSGPWIYGLGILPPRAPRAGLTWSTPAGALSPVFVDPSSPATLQPLQAVGAAGLLDQNLIVSDPAFPYLLSGRGVFVGYTARNTVLSVGGQMVGGHLHQLLHADFRASAMAHASSIGDLGSLVFNHPAPLRTTVDGPVTVSGSWTADLTDGWIRDAHVDIAAPLRFAYTPAGTAAQNKLWQDRTLPASLAQPFHLTMDLVVKG